MLTIFSTYSLNFCSVIKTVIACKTAACTQQKADIFITFGINNSYNLYSQNADVAFTNALKDSLSLIRF